MKRKDLFLMMIVLLGLFLRLYQLDTESLWVDEAFALKHAQHATVSEVIDSVKSIEGAPPGYYVFLHYWIKLSGNSAFSARLPSVIFGVLSIFLIFAVGHLLFNRNIALLSSFFFSTSMIQVLYSQEARLYSLFTFLTLLSAYSFIKWYKESHHRYLLLYALSMVLAIYTNYLTIIIIALYTLILCCEEKILPNLLMKWFLVHGMIGLFSLPLINFMRFQFKIINTGLSYSLVNKSLPSFLAQLGIFVYALPSLIILSLFFLLILSKKNKFYFLNKINVNDYLFSLILLGIGGFYLFLTIKPFSLFGIQFFRQPITHSYFLIRHSLFFAPLVYFSLASIIINLKSKKLYLFCIFFIILVNTIALAVYFHNPTKAQWSEALDFIIQQDQEPLILLDKGGESHVFIVQHYYPQIHILRLTWSGDRVNEGRKIKKISSNDLFKTVETYDSFWLILSRNNNDDYKIFLDSRYKKDQFKSFYQLEVYHYLNNNISFVN